MSTGRAAPRGGVPPLPPPLFFPSFFFTSDKTEKRLRPIIQAFDSIVMATLSFSLSPLLSFFFLPLATKTKATKSAGLANTLQWHIRTQVHPPLPFVFFLLFSPPLFSREGKNQAVPKGGTGLSFFPPPPHLSPPPLFSPLFLPPPVPIEKEELLVKNTYFFGRVQPILFLLPFFSSLFPSPPSPSSSSARAGSRNVCAACRAGPLSFPPPPPPPPPPFSFGSWKFKVDRGSSRKAYGRKKAVLDKIVVSLFPALSPLFFFFPFLSFSFLFPFLIAAGFYTVLIFDQPPCHTTLLYSFPFSSSPPSLPPSFPPSWEGSRSGKNDTLRGGCPRRRKNGQCCAPGLPPLHCPAGHRISNHFRPLGLG